MGFAVGPVAIQVIGPHAEAGIIACPGTGTVTANGGNMVGPAGSKCGGIPGYAGEDYGGTVYDQSVAGGPSASDGVIDSKTLFSIGITIAAVTAWVGCNASPVGGNCNVPVTGTAGAVATIQGSMTYCYNATKQTSWKYLGLGGFVGVW